MKTVFLSASVPTPDRDPRYVASADVVAIKDSIKALVTVLVPKGRLVFGGHPAITPLVRLLVKGKRRPVRQHVIVYLSAHYQPKFSSDLADFEDVRIVPAVANDEKASLEAMRKEMIGAFDYDYAVFVGGMDGVEEEYRLFTTMHPQKPAFPIASTGAAAALLFDRIPSADPSLKRQLTYPTLFRRLLELR